MLVSSPLERKLCVQLNSFVLAVNINPHSDKMFTSTQIENKLKYVCARLKSGCTQGNNSRPLYKQEVLNLQRTERTMLLFRNYLLDKREEEQSIQQEAQSDSSLIERETNNDVGIHRIALTSPVAHHIYEMKKIVINIPEPHNQQK